MVEKIQEYFVWEICIAAGDTNLMGEGDRLSEKTDGREDEVGMLLYLSQFAYTPESWAALARDPEDRSAYDGADGENGWSVDSLLLRLR